MPSTFTFTVAKTKSGGSKKKTYFRRGHNASAPGEYPKRVSGHLRRNIQSEFDQETLTARVGTNVIYGKYLETGTRKMAARPWLSNGIRDFGASVRSIIEGGPTI